MVLVQQNVLRFVSEELYRSLHTTGGCWCEVDFFSVSDSEYAEAVFYYLYAATGTLFFSCWFFAMRGYLLTNVTIQSTCHISSI